MHLYPRRQNVAAQVAEELKNGHIRYPSVWRNAERKRIQGGGMPLELSGFQGFLFFVTGIPPSRHENEEKKSVPLSLSLSAPSLFVSLLNV